jgi:hypothetical protein
MQKSFSLWIFTKNTFSPIRPNTIDVEVRNDTSSKTTSHKFLRRPETGAPLVDLPIMCQVANFHQLNFYCRRKTSYKNILLLHFTYIFLLFIYFDMVFFKFKILQNFCNIFQFFEWCQVIKACKLSKLIKNFKKNFYKLVI